MRKDIDRVNEFEVRFELQGKDFNPDDISALVNIKPTSIQNGQPGKYSTSHWILSSGIQKGTVVDIGAAAESLIDQLKVAELKIIDLLNKYQLKSYLEIEVRLAPHIFSTNYEKLDDVRITFEPEQLRFLTAVNTILNVDIEYD